MAIIHLHYWVRMGSSHLIPRDLTPITIEGQVTASLAAMQRTIDDYDSMAKREMIKAKQEKAQLCVMLTW